MAVGAAPSDVVLLFLRDLAPAVAIGVAGGLLSAYSLATVLRRIVFGVRGVDATTGCVAAGAIALLALTAAWLPARRATRIDPVVALRLE
jgi:ABC-type lipoprotein release transport system permease subunit